MTNASTVADFVRDGGRDHCITGLEFELGKIALTTDFFCQHLAFKGQKLFKIDLMIEVHGSGICVAETSGTQLLRGADVDRCGHFFGLSILDHQEPFPILRSLEI